MKEPLAAQREPPARKVPRRTVALTCAALTLGLLACAANPGTARTRRFGEQHGRAHP